MAWASPPAFVVSEIVTAARMNVLSDDLTYLKGTSAPVQIDNDLTAVLAAGGTLAAQGTNNGSFGRFKLLAKTAGGATIDWRMIADPSGDFIVYDGGASQQRMAITATNGYVGLRTAAAPQGPLHVGGAGGGWLYLSAAAVAGTLVTLAAAGTVTVGMIVWLCDRNNGAGAFASGFNGQVFALTSALTYVNTDTLTLTLTAGGAITIQRTTGTNGTHDVNMAIMYR